MRRLILIAAAIAVTSSACQSASEQITEQIIEQQEGVDNVEFDADTGQVSVETDDGSLTIGGGEVPSGFPVPFADGYEVIAVVQTDEESNVSVRYTSESFDDIVSFYAGWTASQPGDWQTSSSDVETADGQTLRSTYWSSDAIIISVTSCSGVASASLDDVCVSAVG